MRNFPYYFAVHDLQKVVCATQRAASTSIAESLRPAYSDSAAERIHRDEVIDYRKDGWPVLLWLRDPFEKFASAFAVFGRARRPKLQMQKPRPDRDPDEFARHAIMEADAHWSPQTKTHHRSGIFLPTRVYPFYNLAETWAEELPGYELVTKNVSIDRLSWTDLMEYMKPETIALLTQHYEEDSKMLEWCNEYGVMEAAA